MRCPRPFRASHCLRPSRAGAPGAGQYEKDEAEAPPCAAPIGADGAEVERTLTGEPQAGVRLSEDGDRVVSVSIPVRHVTKILGVLTLEAGDVDEILGAQRRALTPFALVALAVNLLASLLLHLFVARPVMRLSAAADEVKQGSAPAPSPCPIWRAARTRSATWPDLWRA
jgi:two-component system sensor histidine kinase ChvG